MATEKSYRKVFQVDGLDQTLALMRGWPKDARKELRLAVASMTLPYAQRIAAAASRFPDPRVRGLARTVRPKKDRLPTVLIGGATPVPVSRPGKPPRAGDLVFGTEFGALPGPNAWRFPPRSDSYWLYRSLRGQQSAILSDWEDAVLKVARKWAS